ncbi:hypothetical protein BKM01_01680 [Methanohalophilus portucalensis]|uniref:UPF0292 protein BKM01_01680 n=1 Tax=Methanohalophilus portucalensis TaxID=39664 RepID=A0A2D3C6U0_9EURY|nr:toprim domain-containing protein [Methanohalophilus portucalensis]ATU09202.1 hypothetical protein BKM01_01680 [Methanohalophilus portucalensis]
MTPSSMYEIKRRYELLDELLKELIKCSDEGDIILVEGKRDVSSLRSLGIHGIIKKVTHIPLLDLSEKLRDMDRCVIILTDWDRRGNILADKISSDLEYMDVDVDTSIRNRLVSLVQKEIKDVESLDSHMKKMKHTVLQQYY